MKGKYIYIDSSKYHGEGERWKKRARLCDLGGHGS